MHPEYSSYHRYSKNMRGLILIAGILSFLGSLLLVWTGGSIFATYRTENITGPGVDIIQLNKYPLKGEPIELEVTARGGSKTGVNDIYVYKADGNAPVTSAHGEGVTWGNTISSKGRGQDAVTVLVPQDEVMHHGQAVCNVEVNYVCAMKSGGGFTNNNKQGIVYVSTPVYTAGEKLSRQLLDLFTAFIWLLVWAVIWYLIAKRLEKRDLLKTNTDKEEDITYSIIGLLFGGCIIGYWIFARFISGTFGIDHSLFTIAMMCVWIGALVLAWIKAKKDLKAQVVH
jgi:hypothetical protein